MKMGLPAKMLPANAGILPAHAVPTCGHTVWTLLTT